MDFKDYFKFPLKIVEDLVFTADGKRALDFARNLTNFQRRNILQILNGEDQRSTDLELTYKDGEVMHKGEHFITIRGWGYLTGIGGLNLHNDIAEDIQDEFGKYIVLKLNPKPNG